jgi:hypothetical protein
LVSRIAATRRTLLCDILRCPQVAVGEGLLQQPVLSFLPLLLYSALYNISVANTIAKKTNHPLALIRTVTIIKVQLLPATQWLLSL